MSSCGLLVGLVILNRARESHHQPELQSELLGLAPVQVKSQTQSNQLTYNHSASHSTL